MISAELIKSITGGCEILSGGGSYMRAVVDVTEGASMKMGRLVSLVGSRRASPMSQ